ncbi:DoxX family protein [Ancylobacter sp. WKF20]|uniref:DoxX family protein n=1 Tax=Ancylobacter sp. WKF20 TaxID=3039801 RepID=UPI0024343346|nr:DoxX family protein [Ancylobacter sp. WKF20]WGD30560.1 DoxX family protein [Ancylobacter sp. WKF20]
MTTALVAPAGSAGLLRKIVGPVLLPDAFVLTDGMNIVRLAAGAFYAPHVIQKLTGIESSLAFFDRAGLQPAPFFLALSIIFETLAFVGLTFGLFTRWIALASAGCLVVAAYAIIQTKGLGWFWARGGIEYLVFWCVISLAVALDAWRRTLKA